MNLINELESELAAAILLDEKFKKKISSPDALNLIKKVQSILSDTKAENSVKTDADQIASKTTAH